MVTHAGNLPWPVLVRTYPPHTHTTVYYIVYIYIWRHNDVKTDLKNFLTYFMTLPNRFQFPRALTERSTSYGLVWRWCNVNVINTVYISIYLSIYLSINLCEYSEKRHFWPLISPRPFQLQSQDFTYINLILKICLISNFK